MGGGGKMFVEGGSWLGDGENRGVGVEVFVRGGRGARRGAYV